MRKFFDSFRCGGKKKPRSVSIDPPKTSKRTFTTNEESNNTLESLQEIAYEKKIGPRKLNSLMQFRAQSNDPVKENLSERKVIIKAIKEEPYIITRIKTALHDLTDINFNYERCTILNDLSWLSPRESRFLMLVYLDLLLSYEADTDFLVSETWTNRLIEYLTSSELKKYPSIDNSELFQGILTESAGVHYCNENCWRFL
jgi:hypothetical protein